MSQSANIVLLLVGSMAIAPPLFASGRDDTRPDDSTSASSSGSGNSGGPSSGSSQSSSSSNSSSYYGSASVDNSGSKGPDNSQSSGNAASSSGHGSAGADDSGSNPSVTKGNFASTDAIPGFSAKLKYVDRKRQDRRDLEVSAKLKLDDTITNSNADEQILVVIFPDGTECEMEFDDISKRRAEYKLKLSDARGKFREKMGSCTTAAGESASGMPDISGGLTRLEHDPDDNRNTENVDLGTSHF